MRNSILIVIITFYSILYPAALKAGVVLVSILNDRTISALVISPDEGASSLFADGTDMGLLEENSLLYVSMIGDEVFLRNSNNPLGLFTEVSIIPVNERGGFSIRPVVPVMERIHYCGGLVISVDFERIKLINAVDEDLYLTGVLEAETGINAHNEFYKAHSVISRTYLYGNFKRHSDEGFYLCDEVHCQVYKGRLTSSRAIYDAVRSTRGKVIKYVEGGLITAAFHSNCGGQTVNSQDVWLLPRPYLRSVTDPYCLTGRNSGWQETIDTEMWSGYLSGKDNSKAAGSSEPGNYNFLQRERKVFYDSGGYNIPLRQIRSDWNLRSAFFNLEASGRGNHVVISGRGYGHGVGFCQEGAMEMASRGYNYMDILKFYYTDVMIEEMDVVFR